VLELNNISKSFQHNGNLIRVLQDIDLQVRAGETVAITGASGVGKSTLLNIMGILEPPTQGRIFFQGQDVRTLPDLELCRLRNSQIGFVFQFHHLLSELNALENTLLPALIARQSKVEAQTRAVEVLTKIGLGQRLNHRIGELSGGEQQRVAIARALMMRPVILLADEPTGNLDTGTSNEIGDLFLQLNQTEGLAIVLVTHNRQLARRMSRQMEIINGQIQ
jgi:lipoprotein-releasing system ATP-binding protein